MTSQLDVRFEGEPGEGYGVARSFFALIAQELVKNQNIPKLDPLPSSRSKGFNIYLSASLYFTKILERFFFQVELDLFFLYTCK